MDNPSCKICGGETKEVFTVPVTKLTGRPMPEEGNECSYWECKTCQFCFTHYLPAMNMEDIYGEDYWKNQDSNWYGRMTESFRLFTLAGMLNPRPLWEATSLDFGCGTGSFVRECHTKFGMDIYGHDIITPVFAQDRFYGNISEMQNRFDFVVACEVLEHLPNPVEIFTSIRKTLKPGGVFAFQTAYYDPQVCDRNWWYVGPANGHISFYSIPAFTHLFNQLGGKERLSWNGYPGVQAWRF